MSSRHDPIRWQQVQDVLHQLLAVDVDERRETLAVLVGADAALAAEVSELLALESQALPEQLPPASLAALAVDALPPGARIGQYVIEALIGEGGSGLVYRAHRAGDFAQTVAIKRIAGARLSVAAARRLQHERDILADLDHPNIVRLIDAGADADGHPFLALEYVDGETWDVYAARLNPNAEARLELFLQVCSAVAYGHQRLLVHRDIKPCNLVISRAGVPKLLDYGIAKLIDADFSTLTREYGSSLTPAYAAPEQLRGEAITTATDLHGLGLLLYETMAGAHPFRQPEQSAQALRDALCTRPPPSLSRQALRVAMPTAWMQDLDRVLAKALQKDASQRYASVQELAEDLRAILAGRPVRARAPSPGYVLRRFIGRHRISVGAAALALSALLGTTHWALVQSQVAAAERARAERRFAQVHHFASHVLFGYQERIRTLSGSMAVQQSIVSDALHYLESLRAEAGDNPELLLDISQAYLRVGDIQGSSYGPNLGDFDGARRSYAAADALLSDWPAEAPPGVIWVRAQLWSRRADLAHQDSRLEDARRSFQRSIAAFESLPADQRVEVDVIVEYALVLDHFGDLLGREGAGSLNEIAAARMQHAKARQLRESAWARHPGDRRLRFGRYQSELREGEYWLGAGDMTKAAAALSAALATVDALVQEQPDDMFYRYEQALVQSRLVPVRDALGQLDDSIEVARQALATTEVLLRRDPEHDTLRQAVAASAGWAARQLLKAGRAQDAVPIVQRQREVSELRVKAAPDNPEGVSALSVAIRREADIAEALGDLQLALARHREALALQERHAALSPDFMQTRTLSLSHIGRVLTRLGDLRAARQTLDQAVADFQHLVAQNPEATRYRDDLAETLALTAEAWRSAPADHARARAAAQAACAIWDADEAAGHLSVPARARRDSMRALL